MKKTLFLFLLVITTSVFAQSQLTVYGTDPSQPLPNAVVKCNGKTLGKSDGTGKLSFRTRCKLVDVEARGFFSDEVVVDKVMEITLAKEDPKMQSIQAVVIGDKSDPRALEILKKVNEKYKDNAPQSLPAYSYKSYEKISLDLDQDSISAYNRFLQRRLDSLKLLPPAVQSEKKRKDSLEGVNVMKLMGDSKLFLWERVTEFDFSEKYGEKITVLDNRVAGLRQPIYEMMALRSNRNKIPREIREENRALYRFFLTDTLEIDGRKNFVIRFRQVDNRDKYARRKFNGYLYVDTQTYAVKKIESNSKKRSEGSLTSIWTPLENKWFLAKENFKFKVGSIAFNQKENEEEKTPKKKFGNYVYLVADYFDFKTSSELKAKDFSGYTMEVKNSDGSLLGKYRTDTLSAREQLTYEKIDSVGKKYKLDQKVNTLAGLVRGNLRFGKVDLAALDVFKYNLYEGVRLGIGAKLNEKFHPYLSPDAYIAYGFKDHTWKYGIGLDVKTTLEKISFFRAEYYDDVIAAGRIDEKLWNFRMQIMNSGVDLHNDRFYRYRGARLSYQTDITNGLTIDISAKKDTESAGFAYSFDGRGAQFSNVAAKLSLKYSPNSKNIMTPAGKYTFEQNYPEVYANFEQGLKAAGGELSYSRIDALLQHSFKSRAGKTGIRLYGGWLLGDAPIWHHFAINGLGSGGAGFKYNLTSYLGFATMPGGKYYDDHFVGYYFTHRLPFYFRTFGKTTSSFDLAYRGIIGDMKKPLQHAFDYSKLDHLYQEAGLEINNFLGTPFNLGFFYRIGYYNTPVFSENFAVQLKLNFLGF